MLRSSPRSAARSESFPTSPPRSPGAAALLHTSAVAFNVLKYLGVAYLLYLAWATFRERGALSVEGDDAPRSAAQTIRTAVLINLLNPKLTIFFFAFLPQFVAPGAPNGVLLMLGLSAVFMAMTFVVFALYGVLRRGGPRTGHLAPARARMDAAYVRGLIRRPGREARADQQVGRDALI